MRLCVHLLVSVHGCLGLRGSQAYSSVYPLRVQTTRSELRYVYTWEVREMFIGYAEKSLCVCILLMFVVCTKDGFFKDTSSFEML